jgi:hypothetical protein
LGLSSARPPQKPPDQHSLPYFLLQHQDPHPNNVGLPGEPTPRPIKLPHKFLLPPVTQAGSPPPGSPPTFGVTLFLTCITNNRPIQLLPSHGKIGLHCLVAFTTDNFLGEPTQINNFIKSSLQERLQPELECWQVEKLQCIQTDMECITANMLQSNLNPIAANFLQLSDATVADSQLTLPVLAR